MDNKGNNENILDALSAVAMDGMNMAMANRCITNCYNLNCSPFKWNTWSIWIIF